MGEKPTFPIWQSLCHNAKVVHAFESNTPFEKLPGTQINVPRLTLHKRPRHRRCPTSRDFVPWRFSDAGRRSAWIASSCRHPKTYTIPDSCTATKFVLFAPSLPRLSIGCAITGLIATAVSNHAGRPADVYSNADSWVAKSSQAVQYRRDRTVNARRTVTCC